MAHSNYPDLFSDITIGPRRLRNRVCLPATVTNYARDNRITDRWKSFLLERAKGGAAMLVTEIVAVDPEAIAQPTTVVGFDDRNNDDFRDIAQRIDAEGATLIIQLWHPGRQQLWHPTKAPAGVSDAPDPYSWTVAHVMKEPEIRSVIEGFVSTAERLWRCGIPGVELHGAHGYLINQFLSPWSNRRQDGWGDSLEGRVRFVSEIAASIKERCGPDFIVGLKMPGTEGVDGGIDPEEAARLTRHLSASGNFDYFAYGQGNFSLSLESHVPDLYFKPGHFVDIHKAMREAAGGVLVMALGRIGNPELADQLVRDGYGDLIGMTRAHLSDAAIAKKAYEGRADEIRPCVFDNFSWGEVHLGKPVAEFHNPLLGVAGEADWRPEKAETRKRVTVIGAGPAGLEAAWTAAARGHEVTLFGASEHPGGALRLEAELPGRGDMLKVIEHQVRMAERNGVKFRLGEKADKESVQATNPDHVILATGAVQRHPEGFECENGAAVSARAYVASDGACHTGQQGTAVLFDQDHGAAVYGLADRLAAEFDRLVLITPRPQFAQAVNYCSAIGVYRRLYGAGVQLMPALRPVRLSAGRLELENMYSAQASFVEGVDLLIYATPRRVMVDWQDAFEGVAVSRIGDSHSPRNLLAAIHGGHHLALSI